MNSATMVLPDSERDVSRGCRRMTVRRADDWRLVTFTMFVLKVCKLLLEPTRPTGTVLRLVDIVLFFIILFFIRVRGGEARIDILWNGNMLLKFPLFTTRDIGCFQRAIFIESSADKIGAVR